jgi:2-polyprenyl-3-methyl-5-hydroxy-6-metoxy-1,4-benzoquinol methylase
MENDVNLECPVCGFKPNLQEKIQHLYQYRQWDLYQCAKCTFQFWWPMKQANPEWWESTYDIYKDLDVRLALESRHRNLLRNMPIKQGKILDIGCGEGVFINELNKRKFDVYGIDLNKWAIAKAKKTFGLKKLQVVSIYDFVDEGNRFELITFFEVLEHVGNPREFIRKVKSFLNEDGFISFSVPDVRMYGPFEELQNVPPYHFNRYSSETLKKFLMMNGFQILIFKKINRLDSTCFLNNILIKLKIKKIVVNKNILTLWKYLSFPLREFLYILGFRSTFFIVAQVNKTK